MYESKAQAPLSHARFVSRLLFHVLIALGLLILSLGIGMLGYVTFVHLSWLDAFLNSAMLLGGMGPVNPVVTPDGKLFAGLYALYAGLVFIGIAALVLTPVIHRVLHKFHWDTKP
jgi:hypothetical protein